MKIKIGKWSIKRPLNLFILFVLLLSISLGGYFLYKGYSSPTVTKKEEGKKQEDTEDTVAPPKEVEKKSITISAAGDFVLGLDPNFYYPATLPAMYDQEKSYSYFLKNVADIFRSDDYTIVNLENPFTTASTKADKGEPPVFHFKADPSFVQVLTSSSVEGVTLSNNHIYDYLQQGLNDTVDTLVKNNIDFTGEGYIIEQEIKGVKFVFLGYQGWSNSYSMKNTIKNDIIREKSKGAVVIPYFHWGIERTYQPYEVQKDLAHFAIDNGADMVLGTHPHVVQSLETYNGKLIAYSLGNFCYGGHSNPEDKRSFILQGKFNFQDNVLSSTEFRVVPTWISSVQSRNDYCPTPMVGDDKIKMLNYLNEISFGFNTPISDEFKPIGNN